MPDLNTSTSDSNTNVHPPAPQTKPKIYPLKPEKPEGFKKAVAWFGGREFIASLKGIVMYAIYGENMDPRSWMKPNIYPNVEEKVIHQKEDQITKDAKKIIQTAARSGSGSQDISNDTATVLAVEKFKNSPEEQKEISEKVAEKWALKVFDYWNWKCNNFAVWKRYFSEEKPDFLQNLEKNKKIDEFWFDYIADSGDGQMGVYGVGCMCLSDLWLKNGKRIDREKNIYPGVKFYPEKNADSKDDPNDLDFKHYELLPRGNFLFVGGDTAYHSANYETIFDRFQLPFRWAFTSVRKYLFKKYAPVLKTGETDFWYQGNKIPFFSGDSGTEKLETNWDGTIAGEVQIKEKNPDVEQQDKKKKYWDTEPLRPLFGVPANHDYYDSIDGFNRQFRRPPFEDVEENMIYEGSKGKSFLQIPTFSREQEASYIAIRLPFDWWFFGIDSENEKLDFRQEVFFKGIMEKKPKKLILATPEPTTVFGKKSLPAEKTTSYLKIITEALGFEQPFLNDGGFVKSPGNSGDENETGKGLCRLDLSGDVHHYARYWGNNTRGFRNERFASNSYASLVAGGGGAFFDTTSTLIGNVYDQQGKRLKDKYGKKTEGEIPPQEVYPREPDTTASTTDKIFDLWNIRKGGYIQHAGIVFSLLFFFFLTQFSNISEEFRLFDERLMAQNGGFASAFQSLWLKLTVVMTPDNIIALTILVGSLGLTALSAWNLNKLIKKMKEKILNTRVEDKNQQTVKEPETEAEKELIEETRILNLLKKAAPFFLAVALYAVFILIFPTDLLGKQKSELLTSLFLLLHLAAAVVLVWLSFEYTNWLSVRFKLQRKFSRKSFTEKLEDPNEKVEDFLREYKEKSDNVLSKIWFWSLGIFLKIFGGFSRQYSYKYFPANIVVVLAIAALVFGIGKFAGTNFAETLGDLILILLVVGIFWLLAVTLAKETGAAYLDKKGKNSFFRLGVLHWFLQLFTPFIVFYYAHWLGALAIFGLVILLSGFSSAAYYFNYFFPEPEKNLEAAAEKKETGWKGMLRPIVNFRFGAWLMKKKSKARLLGFWIIYGLLVIAAALFLFPNQERLSETLLRISGDLANFLNTAVLSEIYASIGYKLRFFDYRHIYIGLSFLILGFIGYRLSRIWFSWYLAVSVLFNGHNNEAGGMARIEGYKHILRIKVEPKKLTVYVIGMNEANGDLNKLKLRLVDIFTLKCFEPKRGKRLRQFRKMKPLDYRINYSPVASQT